MIFFFFQTDLTSSGLSNYKKQRPSINSKFPAAPVVPSNSNNLTNFSTRPVPQKRESSTVSVKNSDKKNSSKDQNKVNKQPRPEIKEKPTFSTFKQFHRTASLSDLLDDVNEDEEIVKPEVIPKKRY